MTMRRTGPLLTKLLALLLCAVGAWWLTRAGSADTAANPVLRVQGSARQGGVLFVSVSGAPEGAQGSCTWQGATRSLAPGPAGLQAVLPVAMDALPGPAQLKVTVEIGSGLVHLSKAVIIAKTVFPVQRLRMSASNEQKYADPMADEENAMVLDLLRRDTSLQQWRLPFQRPCGGRIATVYGVRRTVNGKAFGRHKGVDLSPPAGTPVHASNAGTVILARTGLILFGDAVIIDHGQGLCTLYGHLGSVGVTEGQTVDRQTILGRVGSTGAGTGAHLHWSAYVHGVAVDPLLLLHPPADWL